MTIVWTRTHTVVAVVLAAMQLAGTFVVWQRGFTPVMGLSLLLGVSLLPIDAICRSLVTTVVVLKLLAVLSRKN